MFNKKDESVIVAEELINALEKGARIYKCFEDGLASAQALRALKQSESEITQRIDSLKKEAEAIESSAAESSLRHERMLESARQDIAVAHNEAEKIIANAAAEADKKIAAANDASAQSIAMAVARVNATQETVSSLDKQVAELEKKLATGKEELADLEGRMKKAKDAMKKLLGE